MFPSVSSFHAHPEFVHIPPEPYRSEPRRPSTPISIHVSVDDGHARAGNASLRPLLPAGYVSLPSGKLHPDLMRPGLQIDEAGRRFMSDGEHMYAVRFDRDHRTERVYQPDNPAKPGIPVRLNEEGRYARHADVGLKGGAPGRDLQRRLDAATNNLKRAQAEKLDALRHLARIDDASRTGPSLSADWQRQWRQTMEQVRDRAQKKIGVEERRIETLCTEVRALRESMQTELASLTRQYDQSAIAERMTQIEINVLQAALDVSPRPPEGAREHRRALDDELHQIQRTKGALEFDALNLKLKLHELPRI